MSSRALPGSAIFSECSIGPLPVDLLRHGLALETMEKVGSPIEGPHFLLEHLVNGCESFQHAKHDLNCCHGVCWGTGIQIVQPLWTSYTAKIVMKEFKIAWVKHCGCPEILVHDQGPEFMGSKFQNLARAGKMEKQKERQRVFGSRLRLPGSLLNDDPIDRQLLTADPYTNFHRANEMRTAAQRALFEQNSCTCGAGCRMSTSQISTERRHQHGRHDHGMAQQQVDWKKRLDWTRCRCCGVTNANIVLDLHAWMPAEVRGVARC